MARRAMSQSSSSQSDEEDPIAEARKIKRGLMADEIVEAELAKTKAEREESEAKAAKAKAEREKVESGEATKKEPESGIKTKGEFDIGKFNIQEMLTKQTDELKELKKEAEQAASQQHAISEDLRERLHTKELEVQNTRFEAQMQILTKMIEANASRGSFMDQYNMTKDLATQIGFAAPGAQATDLQTTLELKKLDFEQTREMRRLAREDKAEERRWQLEVRRLDDERDGRKADQARQEKRDDMFAKTPAVFGAAIAKGIIDSGSGGSEAPDKSKAKAYHVEAAQGDSGEVDCPGCNQPIGIGPTARTAVCANCGTRLIVKRTGGEIQVEEE